MRDDVRAEILDRLKSDYHMKEVGHWLRQGTCPQCRQRELFIDANTPWMLKCGRENRCGWTASTKDLYPEAFGHFAERFPATTADPTATADAYMSTCRGLDLSRIRGWYRQGHFSHPRGDRTTPTVVFDIPGAGEAGAFMERLIETVRVRDGDESKERKANFSGEHKGLCWQPPGMTIADGDEVWLVEGCIDAITLNLAGIKVVATLSAGNYPDHFLLQLAGRNITLVWALDNDRAGTSFIRKHAKTARDAGFVCKAALAPQPKERRKKADWNDLHLDGAFTNTKEQPERRQEALDEARHLGALLLAEKPTEKAMLIWERKRSRSSAFAFDFRFRTYWFELPQGSMALAMKALQEIDPSNPNLEAEAARQACQVYAIANCQITFLYFQQDKMTDESWYYTRVDFPHGRHKIKNTFNGAQVATASEFKKRLLSIAPGALFSGSTNQLNWLVGRYLDEVKIVETVDFI
ncbi:MAG: toprim domain-containing protein, partial [Alphaproteobacteria bacterium]|nr:toprim domain-containing protein [Alphaproteobacteria bacterium]